MSAGVGCAHLAAVASALVIAAALAVLTIVGCEARNDAEAASAIRAFSRSWRRALWPSSRSTRAECRARARGGRAGAHPGGGDGAETRSPGSAPSPGGACGPHRLGCLGRLQPGRHPRRHRQRRRTARIWDAASGEELTPPPRPQRLGCLGRLQPGRHPRRHRQLRRHRPHLGRRQRRGARRSRGHTNAVLSAAFSPDGARVVTASSTTPPASGTPPAAKSYAVLRGHDRTGLIRPPSAPTARRVVTASDDGTARIWDAASGKELALLRGHTDAVCLGRLQPRRRPRRHRQSTTHRPHLGRRQRQRAGAPPRPHRRGCNSAAFSPDGTRIVTASDDGTARIWDAASGEELAVLRGHTGLVSFAPPSAPTARASSPPASTAPPASGTPPAAKSCAVLRGHTGLVVRPPSAPTARASSPPASTEPPASGTPQRRRAGPPGRPHRPGPFGRLQPRRRPRRHRQLRRNRPHLGRRQPRRAGPPGRPQRPGRIRPPSAPTAPRIVTASWDRTARIWDAASREGARAVLSGHTDWFTRPPSAPTAPASSPPAETEPPASGTPPAAKSWPVLNGHTDAVASAAFSPDGTRSSPPASTEPPASGTPPAAKSCAPPRPQRLGCLGRLQPRRRPRRHRQPATEPPASGTPPAAKS